MVSKPVYNSITVSANAVVGLENEALILDFLEWISDKPRPYDEVMSAWRARQRRFRSPVQG